MRAHQVVVFGASGDLAKRKIYPALHSLYVKGSIPFDTKIIGYGRSAFDKTSFIQQVTSMISPPVDNKFTANCSYIQGVYTKDDMAQLTSDDDSSCNKLFYLSLPPSAYSQVIQQLPHLFSKNGWNRVVLEKPFGRDLRSFFDLKQHIHENLPTESIYLMDHYLGKSTIEYIRRNPFSKNTPISVDVVFSEALDAAGRKYFDECGIVRDVVQNHLLQVIATLISPSNKLSALRTLSRMTSHNTFPLGQYDDYPFPNSLTATYVDTTIFWNDVPIRIRAGKGFKDKVVEVRLKYTDPGRNKIINIQHGGVTFANSSVLLDFIQKEDAYEVVLNDVFQGSRERFVTFDEVEESWRIVQSILEVETADQLFKYNLGIDIDTL